MKFWFFTLLAPFAILSACQGLPMANTRQPEGGDALVERFLATKEPLAPYQVGMPYTALGVQYEPVENLTYAANGIASVYGPQYRGGVNSKR